MSNNIIKVCHMTSVHKRYDGRILKKECVTLAENGYDVTLLVADNQKDETYCGVKITSINFTPKNRVDRILNAKKKMLAKALELNANIYHFHDPELIPAGIALIKNGAKVIYDSHEDYAEDLKEKSWIPSALRGLVSFIFNLYEKYNAKKFTAIISVTPHIVGKFKKYHKYVYMVTNYPILTGAPQDVINQEKNYICFTGLVSQLWSHENVISAVNLLENDIKYILAGPIDSDYLDKLKALDMKKRINYLGYLDSDTINELQQSSLAGIAMLKYGPIACGNMGTLGNTKLFEYMSAGIPIVCTDFILWKAIIDKWQCGICVSPTDVNALAHAIKYLYQNPSIAKSMGKQGRIAVENEYNWQTQAQILLKAYQTILNIKDGVI